MSQDQGNTTVGIVFPIYDLPCQAIKGWTDLLLLILIRRKASFVPAAQLDTSSDVFTISEYIQRRVFFMMFKIYLLSSHRVCQYEISNGSASGA